MSDPKTRDYFKHSQPGIYSDAEFTMDDVRKYEARVAALKTQIEQAKAQNANPFVVLQLYDRLEWDEETLGLIRQRVSE